MLLSQTSSTFTMSSHQSTTFLLKMNVTLLDLHSVLNQRLFKTPISTLVTGCLKVQKLIFELQSFINTTVLLSATGKDGATFVCSDTAAIHAYNKISKELKRIVTSISTEESSPYTTFLKEVAGKPISTTYFCFDEVDFPTLTDTSKPPRLIVSPEQLNFQEPIRALDTFGPMEELAPVGSGGLMFP